MRYIDADKAKNGIMKFVNEYGEIIGMFVNDFNILLERCAVDAQEVVRCKDCVNWKDIFPYSTCELLSGHWEADMYCSYGDRKGERNVCSDRD